MKKIGILGLVLASLSLSACDFLENSMCDTTQVDMVLIANPSRDFYIDTYEASRSNAVSGMAGTGITDACNYAGTKPWTNVTFEDAKYACESAGKRLCTKDEWLRACRAGGEYPYGNKYNKDTCNVSDNLMNTGAKTGCKTPNGVYDMSGNVSEWVTDGQAAALAGGSLYASQEGLSCEGSIERIVNPETLPVTDSIGFRCCKDTL